MRNDVVIASIRGDDPDFHPARGIRRKVFLEEQSVPEEEEWDGMDMMATHLLALMDGKAVGTLRYYDDAGWLHVGRVAVLLSWRGRGVGGRLMERCLVDAREHGFRRSFLNAQTDKIGFYARFEYRPAGGEFIEAGIPHCRMERSFL